MRGGREVGQGEFGGAGVPDQSFLLSKIDIQKSCVKTPDTTVRFITVQVVSE